MKTKKITRRLLKTIGVLFGIWLVWSLYYFSTWNKYPNESFPTSMGIEDTIYEQQIRSAKKQLKGVSKRLGVPSFSIAIGHNGNVIWTAAEGYSNMDLLQPADPQTQYRVGSTSKAITATGIAKLVDKGRLKLDAVIGDSIRNWTRKKWDFSTRQLLSHTAGIGNYEDFGLASARYTLCNCNQFNSAAEGIKVFDSYKLLYKPGTEFKYSTFDINLASVVMEQAAEQPFVEYMEQHIFQKLGMEQTYADHTKPKSEHFATFYQMEDGYYRERRTLGIVHDVNLSYKWAGGGFISTPTDLVKMGNAWVTDNSFLSQETKREFWSPVRLTNGMVNEQEYALGWRSWLRYKNESILEGKPIWMVHHGGVSKGSMNFLVLFPNYNLVIDASINGRLEHFNDLAEEVRQFADIFLSSITRSETPLFQELKMEYLEAE